MSSPDLRPLLFHGLPLFDVLSDRNASLWPAWRIIRCDEPAWWIGALSAAAAFAQEHNLLEVYRHRLASIPLSELRVEKGDSEGRSSTFPIWQIVNELLVARLLERMLGWEYHSCERKGRGNRRGDWQFLALSGRTVFVEVKSLAERDIVPRGVFSRPSYAPRIRGALREGYAQLPDDGRATLVVVVGREITKTSFGLMHGDLFQALYGQMQITFRVMPYDPTSVRMGPSFREMFVHGSKHRRLGWVAGLAVTGMDQPALKFYAIHNPFAYDSVAMPERDYIGIDRFVVDFEGRGRTVAAESASVWAQIAPSDET